MSRRDTASHASLDRRRRAPRSFRKACGVSCASRRGTAHALDSRGFPIAVMGKTGTTNDFRDALFVGSTYGVDGITVAVRIGFDDNRSLGREGNRRAGGAAGLSGTDAEGVPRRTRRARARVSAADGTTHHPLSGRRSSTASRTIRNLDRIGRDAVGTLRTPCAKEHRLRNVIRLQWIFTSRTVRDRAGRQSGHTP